MTSGLVVITPLATHEVAEDIAARLAQGAGVSTRGLGHRSTVVPGQGNRRAPGALCVDAADLDRRRVAGHLPARGQRLPRPWRPRGGKCCIDSWALTAARPDAVALAALGDDPAADARLKLSCRRRPHRRHALAGRDGGQLPGRWCWAAWTAGRTDRCIATGPGLRRGLCPGWRRAKPALGQAAIRLERFVNVTSTSVLPRGAPGRARQSRSYD
jgi:hypothetical protein